MNEIVPTACEKIAEEHPEALHEFEELSNQHAPEAEQFTLPR